MYSAIIDAAEKLDWSVYVDKDNNYIEFEKYSPAGEDFSFSVGAEDVIEEVKAYASDFDIDEHIEMWIEARHNGVRGVPSIRELVKDAEDIDKMLQELAIELAKLKM